jgi:phospholipid transport system substrate-binding protein
MMGKWYRVLLCVFLLLGALAVASAVTGPLEQVRLTVDEIVTILRNGQLERAVKREKIGAVVRQKFDFRAMSQSTLSTNWRKASSVEQARFVALFSELLEETYLRRIDAYTDEEVKYVHEAIRDKRAVVDTVIRSKTADIPVSYKLVLRRDGWLVYDVVVEEISLIRNFRSSYREIVQKEGISGLLARMEEKIQELRNPVSTEGGK